MLLNTKKNQNTNISKQNINISDSGQMARMVSAAARKTGCYCFAGVADNFDQHLDGDESCGPQSAERR